MNRRGVGLIDRATLVDRLANDVDDAAESLGADGHQNGVAGVDDGLATDETFSGVEGNGSDVVAAEMLGDFEDESVGDTLDLKSVKNWGKLTFELHVDDGTNNLRNLSMSDLCAEATYTTQIVK